jgi:uncharacterized delta-60 repeat protein/RHS repeat-associated protein
MRLPLTSWRNRLAQLARGLREDRRRKQQRKHRSLSVESLEKREMLTTIWLGTTQDGTEGSANGYFTILRDTTSPSFYVNLTVGGTATESSDYSYVSRSIYFPSGCSSLQVPISVINDSSPESDETVQLQLQADGYGGQYYTLSQCNYTTKSITIHDNDSSGTPTLWLGTTQDGTEGGANGYFTILRDNTSTSLSVNVALSGTATESSDYSYVTRPINFPSGCSSIQVPINVINDSAPESDETVQLQLQADGYGGQYYSLSQCNVTTRAITLHDNDSSAKPTLWLDTTQDGTEGGANGYFTISRDITSTSLSVNVTLSGTATESSDYSYVNRPINFPSGCASIQVPISVINDSSPESDETVQLQLQSDGYGGQYYSLSQCNYTTRAITLHDNDSSGTSPTAEAGGPYSVSEGGTVTLSAAGSSDPDQSASTLVYDWDLDGDGIFGETGTTAGRGTETGASPLFSAAGLDGPSSFTVSLRVTDNTSRTSTDTATINVANVAPTVAAGADVSITNGSLFTRDGSFSDPGPDSWTATVDYGDGAGPQALTLGGNKIFTLSHQYANAGTFTVAVTVRDDDNQEHTDQILVTVVGAPPTAEAGGPYAVTEGGTITLDGSGSTDPEDASANLLYQWDLDGDGIYGETGTAAARGNETGMHPSFVAAALDGPGSYEVSLRVRDSSGQTGLDRATINLTNTVPTLAISGATTVAEGAEYTLELSVLDPGLDTIAQWAIDWGDGLLELVSGNPSSVGHVYADGGSRQIQATATDEDGSYAVSGSVTVSVQNVAPTLALSATRGGLPGQAVTITDLGQFTDPGFDNPSSSPASTERFTYTINWGDGTSQTSGTATIDTMGGAGTAGQPPATLTRGSFDGGHTYAARGLYTITVTLSDDDGGSTTQTTTIAVGLLASGGGPYTVAEGGSITLDGSASLDTVQAADTLVYQWDLDGDGIFGETGTAAVRGDETRLRPGFSAVGLDGPSTYAVSLRVSNSSGWTSTDVVQLAITNAAPTLAMSGASSSDEGAEYTLALAATDPGLDTISEWEIDWGDGNVQVVSGNPPTVGHVYADGNATRHIKATATDEDGTYRVGDPGTLNASFNQDGLTQANFAGGADFGYAIARQADGKLVVAEAGDDHVFRVLRYNADGTLDLGFGQRGLATTAIGLWSEARGLALQSDGKIVVAGFTYNGSAYYDTYDFAVARYNADGTLDRTFSDDGWLTTNFIDSYDQANAVAIQSDGKIVVAGTAYSTVSSANSYNFAVARYTATGALDTSFGSGGKAVADLAGSTDYGRAVAIQSSGKIVVAGYGYNGSYLDAGVVRFNANGSLDTSFNNNTGKVLTDFGGSHDYACAMTLDGEGKILVGGGAAMGSTSYDFALARYSAEGVLDSTFGTNGKVTTPLSGADYVSALAVRSDGKILAGGYGTLGSGAQDLALVQYTANGTALDTTFGSGTGKVKVDVFGSVDYGYGMVLDPDGKAVLVGGASNGANSHDLALARVGSAGTLDSTFGVGGKVTAAFAGSYDEARGMAVQADGKVIVVGDTSVGSLYEWGNGATRQFGIVRYHADGTLDTDFSGDGKATEFGTDGHAYAVALAPDGKIVVAGYATGGGYSYDFAVARYHADGTLDTSFSGDGKALDNFGTQTLDYAYAVAVQPDKKVLVAGAVYDYAATGTSYDFAVIRYNEDGTLDTTFGTGGKAKYDLAGGADYAYAMTLGSDGKIVLAGAAYRGSASNDFAVLRLNADGTRDSGFGTNGFAYVGVGTVDYAYAVAVDAQNRVVVAGAASTNGKYDLGLARFTSAGVLDTTFNGTGKRTSDFLGGSDYAYALALDAEGKIVVAGRGYNGATADFALERYLSTGALDTSFGTAGKVLTDYAGGYDYGQALAILPGGDLLVAGPASVAGGFDFGLARYYGGSGGLEVAVQNVAPTLTLSGNQTLAVGQEFTLSDLGQFTDPGFDNTDSSPATTERFTYTINWGDGSTQSTGAATIDTAGGALSDGQPPAWLTAGSFDGTHLYSQTGTYTVTVSVADDEGATATQTLTISVVLPDQLPVVTVATIQDAAESGQAGRYRFTRTKTAGSLTVTYAIDAASTATAGSDYTLSGTTGTIIFADGQATVDLDVTALNDSVVEPSESLILHLLPGAGYSPGEDADATLLILGNQAPTAKAGAFYVVDEGGTVELDGSGSWDVSQEYQTLGYAWDLDGDGIFGETGTNAARGNETGIRPTFSAVGLNGATTRTISLRVTDSGGLTSTVDTAQIDVRNVTPTLALGADATLDPPGSSGSVFTRTASYSDPGTGETWTGRVNYGDGTVTQTLTLNADKSFALSHTYTAVGVYQVHVEIEDGGVLGSGTLTVTVGTVAPEVAVQGDDWSEVASGGSVSLGNTPQGTAKPYGFWIENRGTADLVVTPDSLVVPTGFSLVMDLVDHVIPAGRRDFFQIQLDATSAGTFSGQVAFASNDSDESNFAFTVSGTVAAPTGPVALNSPVGLYKDTGTAGDNSTYNPTLCGVVGGDFEGGTVRVEFDRDTSHGAIDGYVTVATSGSRFLYDPRKDVPSLEGYVGSVNFFYRLVHYSASGTVLNEGAWTPDNSPLAVTMVAPPGGSYSVATLGLANDTGTSNTDRVTSDTTLSGTVSLSADQSPVLVQLEINGVIQGTVQTDRDGKFSYLPAGLTKGTQTPVRARVLDWGPQDAMYRYGSWNSPITITWADDPPPAIAQFALANDTDPSSGGTADATLTGALAGTSGIAYVQVSIYRGETLVGTTWTDVDGHFTYLPTGLIAGQANTLHVHASRLNDAGNPVFGPASSDLTFTYQPASLATVSQLKLRADTGTSAVDKQTTDATLVGLLSASGDLSGVEVQFDHDGDGTVDGWAIADEYGNFLYTPVGLGLGAWTIRARTSAWDDSQGLERFGAWSTPFQFTLEAPVNTAIAVADLKLVEDTGTSVTDKVTQKAAIQGRLTNDGEVDGQLVEFDFNNDAVADGAVYSDDWGDFAYQPEGLAVGAVSVRARAREWDYYLGQFVWGPWSEAFSYTLQSSTNAAPVVSLLQLQSDTGTSSTDNITANTLLVGQVTDDLSAEGLTVQIDYTGDSVADGVAITDAEGRFHFQPPALLFGSVTIRARAVEWDFAASAELSGAWTAPFVFTYQDQPHTAPVLASLALKTDTGTSTTDRITSDCTLTGRIRHEGSVEGVTMEFTFDALGAPSASDPPPQTVTTNALGEFTFAPEALPYDTITVHARTRDFDEITRQTLYSGWTDFAFTYQAPPNAAPTVSELALVESTGTAPNLTATDPTLKGKVTDDGTVEGLLVQFDYDNDGAADGSTTTDSEGNFTWYPTGAAIRPGSLSIRARAKEYLADGTAVVGTWSTACQFTLASSAAATLEVTTLSLANDTGTPGDKVTNQAGVSGLVSGPGDVAGIRIELDTNGDGAAEGTVLSDSGGHFSYTPTGLLEDRVTVRARTMLPGEWGVEYGAWKSLSFVYYGGGLSESDAQALAGAINTHDSTFQSADGQYDQDLIAAEHGYNASQGGATTTYDSDMSGAAAERLAAELAAAGAYNAGVATAQTAYQAALAAAAASFATNLAAFSGDRTSYDFQDFVWPTAPADGALKVPTDSDQPKSNIVAPSYTGTEYDLTQDAAYQQAMDAAQRAYDTTVRGAEATLRAAQVTAEAVRVTAVGVAYGVYYSSVAQAYTAYGLAMLARTGTINLAAENEAHQRRVDAAEAEYKAAKAAHETTFNAECQAASAWLTTARAALGTMPSRGTAAFVTYTTSDQALYQEYTARVAGARQKRDTQNAISWEKLEKATHDSQRVLAYQTAEHDRERKEQAVTLKQQYEGQVALAEEVRKEAVAAAQRVFDTTMAAQEKAKADTLTTAKVALITARAQARFTAISNRASQENTPWAQYQKTVAENYRQYVATLATEYATYANAVASQCQAEANQVALATETRSKENAQADYGRALAKSQSERDYMNGAAAAGSDPEGQGVLDQSETREKANALDRQKVEDKYSKANATYSRAMAQADAEDWRGYTRAVGGYEIDQARIDYEYYYAGAEEKAAARALANNAYMGKWYQVQYRYRTDQIDAEEQRGKAFSAAKMEDEVAFHVAELAWIEAVADLSAAKDTAGAKADADWTIAEAKAEGKELSAAAQALRDRVKNVAAAQKTYDDANSALIYGQNLAGGGDGRQIKDIEALRAFRVTVVSNYLADWKKVSESSPWASYQYALAGAEKSRVEAWNAAELDYAKLIAAANLGLRQMEHSAAKDYTDREADANCEWTADVVKAKIGDDTTQGYAQQEAAARQASAEAKADEITSHDKAVAGHNAAYQDQLSTLQKTRQDDLDAAEWQARRAKAKTILDRERLVITDAQRSVLDAKADQDKKERLAAIDEKWAKDVAEERKDWTSLVGTEKMCHGDTMKGLGNALADALYSVESTLADSLAAADKAYWGKIDTAAETQSKQNAAAAWTQARAIATADAGSAVSSDKYTSANREALALAQANYVVGLYTSHATALEARRQAQNTPLNVYQAAVAAADKAWAESTRKEIQKYQQELTRLSGEQVQRSVALDSGHSNALADFQKVYAEKMAEAEKAWAVAVDNAEADSVKGQTLATAAKTRDEQKAQEKYQDARVEAEAARANSLAEVDVLWTGGVAGLKAEDYLDTISASEFGTRKAVFDSQRTAGQKKADLAFAESIGTAQIALAADRGAAQVTYAGSIGDAWSVYTTAYGAADAGYAQDQAKQSAQWTQDAAGADQKYAVDVAQASQTATANGGTADASYRAERGKADVTRANARAQGEAGYQLAIATQDRNEKQAKANQTNTPADRFAAAAAQAKVAWLTGVSADYASYQTRLAEADAAYANSLAQAQAAQANAQAKADLAYTTGTAPLTAANTIQADGIEQGYNQALVGLNNAWNNSWAQADKGHYVDHAKANKQFGIDVATAEKKAQLILLNTGSTSQADFVRSEDLARANKRLTASEADADRVYVGRIAEADKTYYSEEANATAGHDVKLANSAKDLALGMSPFDAAWSKDYAQAQTAYWTSEQNAGNAWDTAFYAAWGDARSADLADRVTAMNGLATDIPLPWTQYLAQLAATKQSWWTGLKPAYLQSVTDTNAKFTDYRTEVNQRYLAAKTVLADENKTWADAVAGAEAARAIAQANATKDYVLAMAAPTEKYTKDVAQANRDQAVTGTSSAAALTAARRVFASAEASAKGTREVAWAQAEQGYVSTTSTADVNWTSHIQDARVRAADDPQANTAYVNATWTAYATMQTDVADIDRVYRNTAASSYSTALAALATTSGTPWAQQAADAAAADATRISGTAGESQKAKDRAASEATAAKNEAIRKALAEKTKANAESVASRDRDVASALASTTQAVARRTADIALALVGGYTPDAYPELAQPYEGDAQAKVASAPTADFHSTGAADGTYGSTIDRMFTLTASVYAIDAEYGTPSNNPWYWPAYSTDDLEQLHVNPPARPSGDLLQEQLVRTKPADAGLLSRPLSGSEICGINWDEFSSWLGTDGMAPEDLENLSMALGQFVASTYAVTPSLDELRVELPHPNLLRPSELVDARRGSQAAHYVMPSAPVLANYQFDDLGRVTAFIQPDPDGEGPLGQSITTIAYDAEGRVASIADPLGHATQYGYDSQGHCTSILQANAALSLFAYDDAGNLLSLTDPVGNTTTWTYDESNRVTEETNALGYSRDFVYDANGELIRRTDRNGRVIVYTYDEEQRLVSECWYDTAADADATVNPRNVIQFVYDADGRLASESDFFSLTSYTYDAAGRRTSETTTRVNVPTVTLQTQYDESGNRTSSAAIVGGVADFQTDYVYDAFGRVIGISQHGQDGGNPVATIDVGLSYDQNGQVQTIDRSLDTQLVVTSQFTYDAQGRPIGLVHRQGETILATYTWSYDAAGRLVDMTTADSTAHYTYDEVDQLTGATYTGNAPADESFTYDLNGNRVGNGYVIGPNNQLLSDGTYRYEYDPEGNRTRRFIWTDADADGQIDPDEQSQITEYSWDHRNRLVKVVDRDALNGPAVHFVLNTYDPQNRWIASTVDADGEGSQAAQTTNFVYDENQIVLELDEDGQVKDRYLWGPAVDQLLADERSGEVLWPLADHLGTVRDIAVYNAATNVTANANHLVFGAYGEIVSESNPNVGMRIGYTGRPLEKTTGLQNNLYRGYEARVGRWLSEDPIGFEGRDANLDRYVANEPLGSADPTGLTIWGDITNAIRSWLNAFVRGLGTGPRILQIRLLVTPTNSAGTLGATIEDSFPLFRKMCVIEAEKTLVSKQLQPAIPGKDRTRYLSESLEKLKGFQNKAVPAGTEEVILEFRLEAKGASAFRDALIPQFGSRGSGMSIYHFEGLPKGATLRNWGVDPAQLEEFNRLVVDVKRVAVPAGSEGGAAAAEGARIGRAIERQAVVLRYQPRPGTRSVGRPGPGAVIGAMWATADVFSELLAQTTDDPEEREAAENLSPSKWACEYSGLNLLFDFLFADAAERIQREWEATPIEQRMRWSWFEDDSFPFPRRVHVYRPAAPESKPKKPLFFPPCPVILPR